MTDVNNQLPGTLNPRHFPAKLWRMVNNPDNSAICWNDTGDVIVINQQLFEKFVLSPSFENDNEDNSDSFKLRQFSSFIRQLNLYGFKKPKPVISATEDFILQSPERKNNLHYFFNPNFKRDNPARLINLQRLTVENKAKIINGPSSPCRHRPSPHPYYNKRALSETPHIGCPVTPYPLVPPQGGRTTRGEAYSAENPFSQDQRYGISYGSPNVYGMQSTREQYHPDSFQCYQPHLMAVPDSMNRAFPMGFYTAPSPLDLVVADHSRGSHNKGHVHLEKVFQMADTVRLYPPNITMCPSGPSEVVYLRMAPKNKTVQLAHRLPDTKVDFCKVEEPEVEVLNSSGSQPH